MLWSATVDKCLSWNCSSNGFSSFLCARIPSHQKSITRCQTVRTCDPPLSSLHKCYPTCSKCWAHGLWWECTKAGVGKTCLFTLLSVMCHDTQQGQANKGALGQSEIIAPSEASAWQVFQGWEKYTESWWGEGWSWGGSWTIAMYHFLQHVETLLYVFHKKLVGLSTAQQVKPCHDTICSAFSILCIQFHTVQTSLYTLKPLPVRLTGDSMQ